MFYQQEGCRFKHVVSSLKTAGVPCGFVIYVGRKHAANFAFSLDTIMSLKARIADDMKTAMKARDAERLAAIRLLMAAIKQKEVDERIELDDAAVTAVIEKMVKQRRDSITQYEAGNRPDLVAKEQAELAVLQDYMPQQLSEAEIEAIIDAAIASSGAAGAKDMGKVVGAVKPQVAGRADMGAVSARIKAKLAG